MGKAKKSESKTRGCPEEKRKSLIKGRKQIMGKKSLRVNLKNKQDNNIAQRGDKGK